ncbi:Hypp6919 [Branchiostoma lanceolatum]|uniref:Hypp6919 protein n=1 Tax=Branchiostoma lanceolatum TaxID=7740 RepID=A0A8K0E5W3_BRALA|nr:Hypp6919 [Branchiostoma lanceolatum]
MFPESDVIGVDLAAPFIRFCRLWKSHRPGGAPNVKFYQDNGEKLHFPDSTFDVVNFAYVLHEMPAENARRALLEAQRVLKPGGTLNVIEPPYYNNPVERLTFVEFNTWGHHWNTTGDHGPEPYMEEFQITFQLPNHMSNMEKWKRLKNGMFRTDQQGRPVRPEGNPKLLLPVFQKREINVGNLLGHKLPKWTPYLESEVETTQWEKYLQLLKTASTSRPACVRYAMGDRTGWKLDRLSPCDPAELASRKRRRGSHLRRAGSFVGRGAGKCRDSRRRNSARDEGTRRTERACSWSPERWTWAWARPIRLRDQDGGNRPLVCEARHLFCCHLAQEPDSKKQVKADSTVYRLQQDPDYK